MANPPPVPTLTCKDCGYNNEPERVYCHNCGAKLDRSILPREEQIRRESPDKARKRIMRMTNPGASLGKQLFWGFIKTITLSVLAAMLILMALPPEDLAPPAQQEPGTNMVGEKFNRLVATPGSTATFTQEEVNRFLSKAKPKGEAMIAGVKYKRTAANLGNREVRFTMERSFWDSYSLFLGTTYHVEIADGSPSITNVGGNIGRLTIHPRLMSFLEKFLLRDIQGTFQEQIAKIQKMKTVDVIPGQATLTSASPK